MPKVATAVDLSLSGPSSGAVLWEWLYREVRRAILDGRLKRGVRLPPTRELAKHYALSRGTVINAFEQLKAEGYLEGRIGAGTYVNRRLPEDFIYAAPRPIDSERPGRRTKPLSRFARRLAPQPELGFSPPRAFRPEPALNEFPRDVWAKLASRCTRQATQRLLSDSDSRGYRPLREAVASYLGKARGVRCTPDRVIIVAGIQHGLDLTIRLLANPGDRVCVENPCHPIVAAMFRALPTRIIPAPVNDQGLDVEASKRLCPRPRLVYVTPAHQFPLGPTMTVDRRLALLDWVARSGAWVFEDDYDSEFRYESRPMPALQGFDESGAVIFGGSFSKVLLPSLRLGYLVVPPALVEKFAAARSLSDRHSSVIDQATMCEFLAEGHFGRHIRRMRELYGGRFAALREALKSKLGERIELPETAAGIQTAVWLAPGLNAEAVARAATSYGVETMPIGSFFLKTPTREGLLLGFAAYDFRQIRAGVDRLAIAVEKGVQKHQSTKRSGVRHQVAL